MLVLELPLEGEPRFRVFAETAEDELRLRHWLHRSSTFDAAKHDLDRLRDRLDWLEEAA